MARKMKDSGIEWIGEIPEGWEVVQLKRFAEVHNGREIDVEVDSTDSSAVGVYGSGGVFKYTNRAQYSGKAVLFGRKGTLGKPLYVEGQLWAVDTMYFLTYSNRLLEKFSYYQFLAFNWAPYITHTAIPSVVASEIVACYFPIPPLEEQAKIADYLDNGCASLDTILDKTRSSIEEYKKLKQAVITQAVTKGVRGEREMKDSKVDYIGQIPDEWVLCKLRNIGDAQNGISKASEFFGKGTPFVSYSDVYKNYSLPFSVSGLVESTPEEQERYSVKEGDIFFTRTSETIEEVGFSCVCEKDIPNATFAGFLIRVRPFSDKLHTPYAKYYFRSSHLRFYLVKEMNLVTRASLGQSLLKSMPVLLPPLEEQKEIAAYLDAKCAEIDRLIAKKEQLVKELESYKKSLIYEVVTGKREV
ncbi:restriction endonuclease subunit S [Faecalibacterium wellingii]|uniref:Restriction endonuclease subunit S n=1 Tax=Faecalibacterium wellingii TaxID=2929491 RepID=A0ABU3TZ38_9FIRM|nr:MULTISPECIES: restriction endonuclease subunit S [Faecalibacterium]MDU8688576.1 restriction endonuclease subunit S [Faecalibacterium prausnitzii]UQK55622.1 restriction endonuclease subunit S [Faecalibacterium sp. HTF-F]